MAELRVCIDREPPPRSRNERLALFRDRMWQPRRGIRMGFMDGDPAVQSKVMQYARQWEQHTSLRFYFVDKGKAEIRISFNSPGFWSVIGTECLKVKKDEPTMSFGGLTSQSSEEEVSGVVLHEFGHALGCIHEHQNPAGGIKWNKAAVYKALQGSPNSWTKEQVDRNMFNIYAEDHTVYSEFDPRSVMIYPIDKEWTTDGYEVEFNSGLSKMDKGFIRKMYP